MCPVVLTRGGDQSPVSTKFEMREDDNVIRNYGRMLVELAAAIPDGIVCFFVSYSYMDKIVSKWNDMGILQVPPRWLQFGAWACLISLFVRFNPIHDISPTRQVSKLNLVLIRNS
jgi:hypothetical protein